MTLRTLASVAKAARNQGLQVIPTLMREVLLECPTCKTAGLKALASVTIEDHGPTVHCKGCESWGDDPYDILTTLGHDPDKDDPYEIVLRVFDLLWTLERTRS